MVRVVRRELDLRRVDAVRVDAPDGAHVLLVAPLAAPQLELGEERLSLRPPGPVSPVVELRVEFEVVVRLPLGQLTGSPEPGIGHVVAGLPKDLRHRNDCAGEMDLQLAAPAAVIVRADRGLVHPGDQGGPGWRADRGRDEGPREHRSLRRQPVDVGGLCQGLAVRPVVVRLVLGEDPDDIRPLRRGLGACGQRGEKCG